MSDLQNKVQFPIQKQSSSQNGCDSQLDEKPSFPSLLQNTSVLVSVVKSQLSPELGSG